MASQFALLKTKRFLPLFIAQFFGMFNDNAFKSALVIFITYQLISDKTHAQLLINLASGLYGLPFFLFSATAGQMADKFDRTFMARLIKFFEVIFMVIAGIGFYFGQIPLLILTLFLMGTHSAFFGPLKFSIIPSLLKPSEVLGGTGLIQAATFLAGLTGAIIGTLLGGTLISSLILTSLAISVALIGWISSLFIPKTPLGDQAIKINPNIFSEIKKLVQYSLAHRPLFIVMLQISWFIFASFVVVTQFPVYTKSIIGGNQKIVAFFFLTFTLGLAMGSLVCNRLLKGLITARFVPIALLFMCLFTFDLFWTSHHLTHTLMPKMGGLREFLSVFSSFRICFDLLMIGFFSGIYVVPLYAILQTQSHESYRSRIIACNNIFCSFFGVAGAISVIGVVSIGFTIPMIFLSISLIHGILAVIIWKYQKQGK